MYQREIPWETYLHRFGWKDDPGRGLQRLGAPPLTLASFTPLIAAPEEARSALGRGLEGIDLRTITPEGLRSAFDWSMGSLLWKLELGRPGLLDYRTKADPLAIESRARAEKAYLSGSFAEALKYYQICEPGFPQDFTLPLTIGHLHLYHMHPTNLEQAAACYLKAANLAIPRASLYAGRALTFAAFVAYLMRDDASALERAHQAVLTMPPWHEAWFSQARYAALCGQSDLCIQALEYVVRLDRNYALRTAACPDFAPFQAEMTALFERLKGEARQQAEQHARSLQAGTASSPIPAQETGNTQRMQAEIAERWNQNTYFGYQDTTAKMIRFKLYLEGLKLPERDQVIGELAAVCQEFRDSLEHQLASLPGRLQEKLLAQLKVGDEALANPPSLAQASAALEQVRLGQALWKLVTSQTTLTGHNGSINILVYSPDGRWLVSSGSWDLSLRVWDTHTGEMDALMNSHHDIIHAAVFSPDGKILASGGGDYKGRDFAIRLWDFPSRRTMNVIAGHTNQIAAMAINPSGSLLASASADFGVRLWRLPSGESAMILDGHTAGATCLAWSPDGSLLLSGGEDLAIRIWNTATGSQVGLLLGHEAPLVRLLLTPDGKTLVSQSDDQTLRVWDLPNQQLLAVLDQPARVNALALSPDGSRLAWTTGVDGLVRLWSLGASEPPQELQGHTGRVPALAFSPDGQILASGGEDGLLRLWDAVSGERRAIRRGHTGEISCLAFSPGTGLIASGGIDRNIILSGLVLTDDDAAAVAAETQERARRVEEARLARLAEQERQRQAWRTEGRCEVCGVKLGLVEKISGQTRCKEHR